MIKPYSQSSASAWPSAAALISCATYTFNIAYKKQNASKKFCLFSTTPPLERLERTELRRPFDRLQIERKVESPPDELKNLLKAAGCSRRRRHPASECAVQVVMRTHQTRCRDRHERIIALRRRLVLARPRSAPTRGSLRTKRSPALGCARCASATRDATRRRGRAAPPQPRQRWEQVRSRRHP